MFKKLFDRLENWLDEQDKLERRRLHLVRLIRVGLIVALKRNSDDRLLIDQLADLEIAMMDASDQGDITKLEDILARVEDFR